MNSSLRDFYRTLKYPTSSEYIYSIFTNYCNRKVEPTANALGCAKKTVRAAIQYKENPFEFVHRHPGPEPMLKAHHIFYIDMMTMCYPRMSDSELAHLLVETFEDLNHCGHSTVATARKSLEYQYGPPRHSVYLSQSAKNKRVEWCQYHLQQGTSFDNVVFSDESWFKLGPDNRWMHIKKGDYSPDVCAPHKKFVEKIMIWGAIGKNFKSELVIFEDNVTAENYLASLAQHNFFSDANQHYGENQWIFQQDNARPHTAKVTIEALKADGINVLEHWPPYSPDLNVIELVWAIMKRRIDARPKTTIDDLKRVIQEVWDELSFETINKLIDSVQQRLQLVVEKHGETIFSNELKQMVH